jgi:hypothetical protein
MTLAEEGIQEMVSVIRCKYCCYPLSFLEHCVFVRGMIFLKHPVLFALLSRHMWYTRWFALLFRHMWYTRCCLLCCLGICGTPGDVCFAV